MLLKTPTSQLAVNGGIQHPDKRKQGGHGPTLADEVEHLLPTPTAMDSAGSRNSTAYRSPTARPAAVGDTLTDWLWNLEGHVDPKQAGAPTPPPSTGGKQ